MLYVCLYFPYFLLSNQLINRHVEVLPQPLHQQICIDYQRIIKPTQTIG
jgi:hypothetical protein